MMYDLSFVIPVYNQGDILFELVNEISNVFDSTEISYEIIFTDDASDYKTKKILNVIKKSNRKINILTLKKNVGQANAVYAGLSKVEGQMIIIMDSDMQDKPSDALKLYMQIKKEQVDMVLAKRKCSNRSKIRNIFSVLFYWISRLLTKIHQPEGTGVFRIISASAVQELFSQPIQPGTILSQLFLSVKSYSCLNTERNMQSPHSSGYSFSKLLILALTRFLIFPRIPHKTFGVIMIAFTYLIYLNTGEYKSLMVVSVLFYLIFLLVGQIITKSFYPHFEEESYEKGK